VRSYSRVGSYRAQCAGTIVITFEALVSDTVVTCVVGVVPQAEIEEAVNDRR
jgi:hypothetical protein